jgi:hypothetical protein
VLVHDGLWIDQCRQAHSKSIAHAPNYHSVHGCAIRDNYTDDFARLDVMNTFATDAAVGDISNHDVDEACPRVLHIGSEQTAFPAGRTVKRGFTVHTGHSRLEQS